MCSSRPIAILVAVLIAAVGPIGAQTITTNNSLEEKVRQANALQDQGNLKKAREIYESALKTMQRDEPSLALGDVLNGLSNISYSEGDYRKAVEFAGRAFDAYHKLGNPSGQSAALNSRGIAEGELGQYHSGQASLRQALTLSQSIGDHQGEVRTLNNLGNVLYFPGDYLEALRAYIEALQIVEHHSADKWSDYWRQITKINQATLYQRLGRYQNALQLYKEIETSKGLTASDRAHFLTNLGALYRRLGDSGKALDTYSAALSLYTRQHDSEGEISVLKNIGIVYALDRDDLGKAQTFFENSLSRAEGTHNQREEMQSHLYLAQILLRKKMFNESQREFEKTLTYARQLGTPEEQWKALYGIGQAEELSGNLPSAEDSYRAAILLIETTRTRLQLAALRAEFLADKRDVYDALIALLVEKNDVKGAFSFLERSRARTFQDRLLSTSAGREATRSPDLDEIRKYLSSSTILLEFWVSGDHLALIWCTRESFGIEKLQLSPAERDNALSFVRELPESLRSNWRERTAVLTRLISAGLASAKLRHVLIVPDGWLSSMPFDLVPSGSGSGELLIERFDITYLPTAALLRRPPPRDKRFRFPWMRELVAFGNPVVQPQAAPLQNPDVSSALQPLPYSEVEIQSISKMTRGKADLFLGPSDLKSSFIASITKSTPIVHVSTHAYADAEVPENSRMLFSPETSKGVADYVFLRELYDLDLRDVDLATLSACNTEQGKLIRGEGVQAFSRALLSAGSRSTLTTLWRVSDQPTSEFMQQFYYFALQDRQSKAEALRSAKLKFLHSKMQFEYPAQWAGFVLSGDGLSDLPTFVSWRVLAILAVIAILLLASCFSLALRFGRRNHRVNRF